MDGLEGHLSKRPLPEQVVASSVAGIRAADEAGDSVSAQRERGVLMEYLEENHLTEHYKGELEQPTVMPAGSYIP